MTLTLEIIGPQGAQLGAAARKVFAGSGGTIGRSADNAWVIPDPYISSHHARVHFRDGRYLLEDTSTNGVFIKSPGNRLAKGQLHVLQSGDRVFIDAFEIKVTVAADRPAASSTSPFDQVFGADASRRSAAPAIPDDPFGSSDPFAQSPPARSGKGAPFSPSSLGKSGDFLSEPSADPLELLGLGSKPKPSASAPRAADLAGHSPLSDHYEPPLTMPLAEPADAVADALIPDDYDPLDPLADARSVIAARPPAAQRPVAGGRPSSPPEPRRPAIPDAVPAPSTPTLPPLRARGAPASPPPVAPLPSAAATKPSNDAKPFDFATLLAAAGVPDAELTPELAENFGRILRVVVAGLMDVLRARGQIKEEFRMRATTFKVVDNNPLKFSANVEDALHNLLVKRNSAYLGPVAAFEDAFDDVRHHQMAMLAGIRLAFDAMLNAFEPEQLQQQFDRQLKRGSILAVPAKLKYWELYRERFRGMVEDSESSFRDLFGEEFARAYEEQLARLKTAGRHQKK